MSRTIAITATAVSRHETDQFRQARPALIPVTPACATVYALIFTDSMTSEISGSPL
jgi:hypothetical protein